MTANRHQSGRRLSPPWWMALLVLIGLTAAADAKQHLVQPGLSWSHLDRTLRPGDEIILMPGVHRPANLDLVHGTPQRPITIRGLDPRRPSRIDADRYGIRLVRPAYVRLENIEIIGASIHGLVVDGSAKPLDESRLDADPSRGITIQNVTIKRTGPRGTRHAMVIRHVNDVQIESGTIESWAGSGIEVIGCRNVDIREMTLRGSEDADQRSGIRVRAGSAQVTIERCLIENAGHQAICVGGKSSESEWQTPLGADTDAASVFEASSVYISDCTLIGGLCSVALCHAEHVNVQQSTLIRPRDAVISIRRPQNDPRFGALETSSFGNCLIAWEDGDVVRLLHLGRGATADQLFLESNLWWGAEATKAMDALGPFPGTIALPQVTDIDPQLDERWRPQNPAAEAYGVPAS